MILRFLRLTATFLLLNLKAYGYTAIVVGNDQMGQAYFFRATDNGLEVAYEKARSTCQTQGMLQCRFFHGLDGVPSVWSRQSGRCLAIVARPSSPLGDSIYRALAETRSEAISRAKAECEASGPSCVLRELVCDPEEPSAIPASPATEKVSGLFDGRRIAEIIDHIRDDLKLRAGLVFYAVAFGFGLFVVLSLFDVIANDRRSMRRMAINLLLSCAAAAGIVTTGFVAPPIWEWILSLDTPAIVLLTTVICGIMLLFIPQKVWQKVKERNTLERTSLPEPPEESPPAVKVAKAELNKKAIKEAALRPRTEEFDL